VLRGGARGRRDPAAETRVSSRPHLLRGENLPGVPQQKRSREKRTRLKTAALALFGERGYEGTSIEEIAAHAGFAVGGFYQHFRSKRQLLLALMDEWLERLSRLDLSVKSEGAPRDRLHQLLTRAFSADMEYLPVYRAWQEASLSDPELARMQNEIHDWTTTRVIGVFEWLQKMPGTRHDVDIRGLARAMDALFWSLLAQALYMSRKELKRWIDAATHLIYHALFTD